MGKRGRKTFISAEELRDLYKSGCNQYQIAERFGVHQTTVNLAMKRYGIPSRSRSEVQVVPVCERIKRRVITDLRTGCWIWMGCVAKSGYGSFRLNHKNNRTHRISYEAFKGPIPAGLCVLHKCDVPLCCNPEHLFLGTQSDNLRDCVAKGRHVNNLSWARKVDENFADEDFERL